MITAKEARKMAMEAQRRQAWYASINANRVGMKCHYYQVNDNVCFEYWNKHEWEFTMFFPLVFLSKQALKLFGLDRTVLQLPDHPILYRPKQSRCPGRRSRRVLQ